MALSDEHRREIYWLNRRIRFLEKQDALRERNAEPYKVVALECRFMEVEHPIDLAERLKEIYGSNFALSLKNEK